MKVATWNVNGIRARQQQFAEWVEAEQPDIICLQEIKASPAQVPAVLQELADYKSFWHGSGGYSGVSLHIKTSRVTDKTVFEHPTFDYERRMVQAQVGKVLVASVYVPNGGKDFAAKMRFLAAMKEYVREVHAQGSQLLLCAISTSRARRRMFIRRSANS
jgi:exodeoxyribonuclease-3